jgi:AcrR family transcriptional regulator
MASKEQTILAAAREIFAKYGYKKTTLEDIGRQVGLNQASLYYYFKSKGMLFLSVIIDDINSFKENIVQALAHESEIPKRLKRYFTEKLHFMSSNTLIKQVLELNAEQVPMEIRNQIHRFQEFELDSIQALITTGVEAGVFRPVDSKQVASILVKITGGIAFGRLNRLLTRAGETDQETPFSELEFAMDTFLKGLAPDHDGKKHA